MPDHDAELGAIVATLSEAGMVETFTDDDGKPGIRLTPEGARVARQMGMGDDPDGLLDALLANRGRPGRPA
jgi:hypothetical protein